MTPHRNQKISFYSQFGGKTQPLPQCILAAAIQSHPIIVPFTIVSQQIPRKSLKDLRNLKRLNFYFKVCLSVDTSLFHFVLCISNKTKSLKRQHKKPLRCKWQKKREKLHPHLYPSVIRVFHSNRRLNSVVCNLSLKNYCKLG